MAIGHTGAPPEVIRDAVKAGATLSTHLGNGCANIIPRHPNFIWEQLAADELMASLIVDGHHLPPATVKAMVRAKTPRRTILVTDAIAAAGQPPGEYQLAGVRVRLDQNGRVAVPGAPNLAGSALAMDRAVANTVRFAGVPLEDALAMASTNPATYLGIQPSGTLHLEWDPEAFALRVMSRISVSCTRDVEPGGFSPSGDSVNSRGTDQPTGPRGNRATAAAPTSATATRPVNPAR